MIDPVMAQAQTPSVAQEQTDRLRTPIPAQPRLDLCAQRSGDPRAVAVLAAPAGQALGLAWPIVTSAVVYSAARV